MLEIDFVYPSLKILYFVYDLTHTGNTEEVEKYLIDNGAVELYKHMVDLGILKYNDKLFKEIEGKKEINYKKVLDNYKNELDEENKIKSLAEFYAKTFEVGNFDKKTKELLDLNQNTSFQLDIKLCKIRIALIIGDKKMLHSNVEQAKHISTIADWDRRNRFKVYLGFYALQKADFESAANYFYECISSFEANELCDFENIVLYLVFSGLLSFSRNDIETKLVNNFEVLKYKKISKLAETLYNCEYNIVFDQSVEFSNFIEKDVFLSEYKEFFVKEMLFKSYSQFLLSYQSVDLVKMAQIFGVRPEFIEEDIRNFIFLKRINCEIDKLDNMIIINDINSGYSNEREMLQADCILKSVRKTAHE